MSSDRFTANAAHWLSHPHPYGSTDESGTVAEHHGVDEHWPGRTFDGAIDNVVELVTAAIADGVIPIPLGTDIDLTRTVDSRYVATGFLIIADTGADVDRCIGTFDADDLTAGETGEAGALAALSTAAERIHALISTAHTATPSLGGPQAPA
ncbi:hypothetical protein AB0H83_45875 [Dactylosporangium sp. NPDC050688]|uniref:hypothetical protein n=1 Tax=Dactylosporangium sp. NPDC050688 TaxID=3157217 RepID=UPI0033EF19E3